LNEILASLVCIINIVRFEFEVQTLFFLFKPSLLDTCIVTQILTHKCAQLNSLLSRPSQEEILKNLSDFSRGFEPLLKFIEDSNIQYVPIILARILLGT
jgi:hypothetical protein